MRELKQVKDHKGNKFRCCQDMCAAYNINPNTFRRRLKMGLSLEDALTRPVGSIHLWENRKGYRY